MCKLLKISILFIFLGLLISSCDKNNNIIPSVFVDRTIFITQPQYNQLNAIGGWVYLNDEGVRGIIVYRKTIDEFRAYDRNCTYDPAEVCATVDVESSGLSAKCPCCNSVFELTDGLVINPPATVALKQYQTFFDGAALRITN
jgi:nitrite reductase/ring-hydroxylating ferredoxin subunit